jgi:hypothetical protein
MARPVRISVGAQRFSISNHSPAAERGRALRASFGSIVDNLARVLRHVEAATPEILEEALKPTFEKSQIRCPSDTGAMKASGFFHVESFRGNHVVAIGYGKNGTPGYTVFVHEIPAQHAAPTQAKWLQSAIDEDYFDIVGKVPRLISEAAGL